MPAVATLRYGTKADMPRQSDDVRSRPWQD